MGPSMKEKLSRYFFYFMLYSIIGWIYEVFLEVVIYRWGYSNRGVLFGPCCVIYGVGALILLFSLQGLKRRSIRLGPVPITPVLVFVAIVVITTVVELIGSYIMEWTTGGWLWDYHRFAFNFQGRIALNPSLRFGVGGMILLYGFQPLLERLANRLPAAVFSAVIRLLLVLLAADAAFLPFR